MQTATAILITGSDPNQLDVLSFLLRREQFEVHPARDVASALRLWRKNQPHLLLIDLDLPDQGGWELCSQIRQESDVPIILLAGTWSEADAVRGFAMGVDDYITQPFSLQEFLGRVRAILRRSAAMPHEEGSMSR
jgi:DNA-binding response OmpR family regulator